MSGKALMLNILVGVCFLSCGNRNNIHSKKMEMVQEKIISNNNEELLVGDWVEPNPIDTTKVQGIELQEDGSAKSINMATLFYSKWWVNNGQLILVAQSLGNSVVTTDSTAFDILKINRDSLVLKRGNFIARYSKK